MPILVTPVIETKPEVITGVITETCINCKLPVQPCGCRINRTRMCEFPFEGYVHSATGSHLCEVTHGNP